MEPNQLLQDIKTAITGAKTILIVTHGEHTHDSVGSTLSLYLGLTSLGKTVTVASPKPLHVNLSDYIGADQVRDTIGKKNFVISLPYKDGSIEKVSYNIEDDQFNLVVEPREGFEFSKDMVTYSAQGGSPDCIITIDTIHLGKLGSLYEENKDVFAGASTLINIDTHDQNSNFGTINLVDPEVSSTIELVAVLLSTVGVQLTTDIASNILNAVYETTKNFTTPKVNGRTFEVASVCMKAGARRFEKSKGQEVLIGKREEKQSQEEVKKEDEPVLPEKKLPVASVPAVEPEEWLKPDMNAGTDHH